MSRSSNDWYIFKVLMHMFVRDMDGCRNGLSLDNFQIDGMIIYYRLDLWCNG